MTKLLLVLLFIFSNIQAKSEPVLLQEGELKPYCPKCGMHLKKFYKTNHFTDGKQLCSMHCLVEVDPKKDSEIKVVDTKTLKFIDAKKAFYVVGSAKKGTMTQNSKFAFEKQSDAKAFIEEFFGNIVLFDKAFEIAKGDFKKDMMMISKKRSKMAKMGEKIHSAMCNKEEIAKLKYDGIGELKAKINKDDLCSGIKKKKLQAIAIYIASKGSHTQQKISVPKDAKCPVCGMFVAKYPKWSAVIDGKYFDGVKDMMKYYFDPKRFSGDETKFKNLKVSDYYTLQAIPAKKAFYVIGSNIYGPMGDELIPFKTKDDAKAFLNEHNGKKIVKFDEITEDLVYKLDQ